MEYLLKATLELKEAKAKYDIFVEKMRKEEQSVAKKQQAELIENFEVSQKATTSTRKRQRPEEYAITGYWMAEHQPEHSVASVDRPPDRPQSPFSGNELRLKDLQPLLIKRSKDGKVLCAVSDKVISTQPAIALCGPSGGNVILEEVYAELVQPNMVCPITSKKLKAKHILKLIKGKSGFAASGIVEAKVYRPTIT